MEKNIYSRKEVAALLGVGIDAVRKWEDKKLINAEYRLNGRPRYTKEAIDSMIKKQKV